MSDSLGDRMKMYEKLGDKGKVMPLLPVIARMDGRSFHSFTKGMERPFCKPFAESMINTTISLVKETGACVGYTQSDEITLGWYISNPKTQMWFDGKITKMVSQLASLTTLFFYQEAQKHLPEYYHRNPTFDSRVWTVPNLDEMVNAFLWREMDATKNSISMAAHSYYAHSELQNKNSSQKQELLFQKHINWNNYPSHFKRGTYIQRKIVSKPFTTEELVKLPEKHHARSNPDLMVERSEFKILDLPPIATIRNASQVLCNGADYILASLPN